MSEVSDNFTMARNQLGLNGGTKSHYTPDEWAEAVAYWSIRVGGPD